ncbi:hypothetical protein HSISS2_2020 [Streptococcus sp. HSISS2]|nr:hypothetical protein HSISS2_2020 [Streptococcus sp. HSISS2]
MEIYILEDNLIQQGRLEMVLSQELKNTIKTYLLYTPLISLSNL